jgi:hypothetical protein
VPAQEGRAAASEPHAFERLPFGPARRGRRATPTQSASQRWSRPRRRPPSSARRQVPVPSVDRARCRRSRPAGAVPPSTPSACERPRSVAGARRGPRAMPTQSASRRWSRLRRRPPPSARRSLPVPGVDRARCRRSRPARRWSRPRRRPPASRPPFVAGARRGPRAMPTQSASRRWSRLRRHPPPTSRRSVPVPGVDRARCRRSRRAGAGPALDAVRLRAPAVRCRCQAWTARDADAVGEPALVPPSAPSASDGPPVRCRARRGPRAMPTQSASRRRSRFRRGPPASAAGTASIDFERGHPHSALDHRGVVTDSTGSSPL